jgi:hypothetical protein
MEGGGHAARNPGQQWLTQFDGRGFVVKPDSENWSWGLQLQCYGAAGHERAIAGSARASAEGQQVSYVWDASLTEWYKNDARGLEHGYTLNSPPAGADGLLTFNLAVRGDLLPRVEPGGRAVRFVDVNNTTVVNYSDLHAFDADAKRLPARFNTTNNGLQLSVDASGARYPLTIDPTAQQAYLKASNANANDQFGYSVAASGNTVVVGAHLESSNATGVNGNQGDNSAANSGAAYVFVRNAGAWSQQAYLKASNTQPADWFGYSVSVSGDTIVVGALHEDSDATGVNGDQSNNNLQDSGAAYVFVRNGTTWSQQAYLKASNSGTSWHFGAAVAVSGDRIVAGAYGEDSNATGVNGNQNDLSSGDSGAAYVFVRNGAVWSQEAYLKASNTGTLDWFGLAVAISSDTVVVGAYEEDSLAAGVDCDPFNNGTTASGAAYVFARVAGVWSQQAFLKSNSTDGGGGDRFGYSLAVSGDTVVVGARLEDSNATGVNGNPNNNSAAGSGAAYVFVRNGTVWSQQAYLKSSNSQSADVFGSSVSVSGDTIVVGAGSLPDNAGEASNATGVNGNQLDNSAAGAGAAYVFKRTGTNWSQLAYLKASNTGASDFFGHSIAISGNVVVVGAPSEDSNATVVNGNQSNNSASLAGAAYTFDLDDNSSVLTYGTGTPGCAGPHALGVNQEPMINSPAFAITCNNSPPSSVGLCIVTDAQDLAGSDPFAIGVLLHVDFFSATEVLTFDFLSDPIGNALTVGTSIPNNLALVGKTYYAMALWGPWSSCSLAPFQLSTSEGLAFTIQTP